jgi:hypothetical protein
MKLYFTFTSMPELQALPARERQKAYSELIHPLLMGMRVRVVKSIFLLAVFYDAFFAGLMESASGVIWFFVGCLVADHLFDISAIRILRQRLQAAVNSRIANL